MTQASLNVAIRPMVRALVAQTIGTPQANIHGSSALGPDLGATSLDSVELVMAVEDAFAIEISDDLAATVITVGDLEELVLRLQATRQEKAVPV